jgi:hypothetical protein
MRPAGRTLVVAGVATLARVAPAEAQGLSGRTDLPIAQWLFAYAAAAVLGRLVRRARRPLAHAAI